MRKWAVRLLILAAIVAVIWTLRVTVFAPSPVEVEVVRPTRGRVESTVTNSKAGTVQARRRANLSPEQGGLVIELAVREGDIVQQGQVLLRLDSSTQRAQLERARKDLVSAQARHREVCVAAEQAQREYERYRTLAEREIISRQLVEQAESRARTSEAGCEAAAAAVESASASIGVLDNELRKTVLRAPFGGVISELSVEIGEYTTPSPPGLPIPPVMEIIDTSSIYVSAPMDEVDSGRIRLGQPVRVTLDPHPGQSFAGTVARVAPYVLDIEAQNRTVEIEVQLQDEAFASTLLPGTSADVEVILEVLEDVLRIPTSTLLPGNAVLVVEVPGVLARRQVDVGLRNWDFTEIRSGLSTEDRVVTSLDRVEVQPGTEVVVADDEAGD